MYVAILGYGVVGSGVAAVLKMNYEHILKQSMQDSLELKYILDLRTFPGDPNESLVTDDFQKIVGDPEVKIVVETMGGLHPAYEFVSACLNAGKSVVTSNKELVAEKGYELLCTAEKNNVNFLFEASVGGGIPIIRPITQCLSANEITEVAGILNGTTNFILTKMIEEKSDFASALSLAQQLGYAEKDPTADIEGADACRKICILAALCFGYHVYPDSVYTEGISKIAPEDVEYAKSYNSVIKLIASAKRENGGKNVSVRVSPAIIRNSSQLAGVRDVFNAILVRGNAVGDAVFYGRGAGKLPTASAVVADVIDCAKHTQRRKYFGWSDGRDGYVLSSDDFISAFYVRTEGKKGDVLGIFPDAEFLSRDDAPGNETAFITKPLSFGELKKAVSGLSVKSVIRVTDY